MKHILPDIERLIMGNNTSYQKVASFILAQKDKTLFLTLDVMANEIGVSTTTVLRFARELGFSGYKDFQAALRNEIIEGVSVFSPYTKLNENVAPTKEKDLLSQIKQTEIDNIKKTLDNLNPKMLSKTAEYFWNAKGNVYVAGIGSSFSLAYLAYTRFLALRKNIFLCHQDIAEIMDPLVLMNSDDVCFFFIFHRFNTSSINLIKEMYARGVKMILITDYPCDEVAIYGNAVLPCFVDTIAPKNSLVGAVSIIDFLCASFAFKNRKAMLKTYAEISKVHTTYDVTK